MSASVTDVVVLSGVVITGSTMIRRIRKKSGAHMQTLAYGFLLVFVLLIIAVPAPGIAKALAYMGMVGALAANGSEVAKFVTEVAK